MAIRDDWVSEKNRDRVIEICQAFIQSNRISCPDAIYQVDRVLENAPDLIEAVANILGYYKYPEE